MYRAAFGMELRSGCFAEYVARHAAMWPEVVELLAVRGVRLAVHRLAEEQLILLVTAPSEEAWKGVDDFEVMQRWDAYLAELFVTEAGGLIAQEELPLVWASGTNTGASGA